MVVPVTSIGALDAGWTTAPVIDSTQVINRAIVSEAWKRLDGSQLDGSEHSEKDCQNVPGVAGAAVGAAAEAAAASAVCI